MRNKKVRALILGIIVASVVAITLGVLAKYEKDKFDARTIEAQEYEQTLNSNTRSAYIAIADIHKGDRLLTQEMVDEMMARIAPEYLMKRPLFDAVTLLRRLESSPENLISSAVWRPMLMLCCWPR